ncbi:hypothetical protein GCK72_018953 [Caenorhabditis remanei]|nr:hypothetical protein GCK72_018953 [Caenorhabditis remanei]KAF1752398.1 hypothetical protein GCK72_018953 [Caenorhabditis remanei]
MWGGWGRDDTKCRTNQMELMKVAGSTNWKNMNEVQEFRNTCENLQNCNPRGTNGFDALEIKQMRTYCERMVFMPTKYSNCIQNVNMKNSKCWQSYQPAPGYSCFNIFGSNDCVKNDIVEVCGQEVWNNYRDDMIVLLTAAHPLCIFDRYQHL